MQFSAHQGRPVVGTGLARCTPMLALRRFLATPACAPKPKLVLDADLIQEKINRLPFFVERTKVGRNLPVYSEFRHRGQQKFTIIRRIYGDVNELGKRLAPIAGKNPVECRPEMQMIRIKGYHVSAIRKWLTYEGF